VPNKLAQICTDTLRNGVDFPTLWETVLKAHPLVAGNPIQRLVGTRPLLEIPLVMGRRLLIDSEAKTVELGYRP
jgi:hypothetical protein